MSIYPSLQVGLQKMATEHTKLIYVTTGVLLQKLVGSKTLTEYSHIFIDEVHQFINNVSQHSAVSLCYADVHAFYGSGPRENRGT